MYEYVYDTHVLFTKPFLKINKWSIQCCQEAPERSPRCPGEAKLGKPPHQAPSTRCCLGPQARLQQAIFVKKRKKKISWERKKLTLFVFIFWHPHDDYRIRILNLHDIMNAIEQCI